MEIRGTDASGTEAESRVGAGRPPRPHGIHVEATGLTRRIKNGSVILSDVSLSIEPGELVAIVGGSGAGKTTLLEALAAVQPADAGRVRFDGVDAYSNIAAFRQSLGYVPQDDIIHAELPLERTLRYAARLRLPASATSAELDGAVRGALEALDLSERAGVRVASLSGGQRKRASIAVELLTRPRVFFLDEPTSGLDPATGAELLRVLRRLAESGASIVFTTHAVEDLQPCDRVVFLAPGGHCAFVGSPQNALDHFEVERVEHIYERLAEYDASERWAKRSQSDQRTPEQTAAAPAANGRPRAHLGDAFRQWRVVTQRTLETVVRNKLTMAIMLGSPAIVVAMFAILFRQGAFDPDFPEPTTIQMVLFWVTFGAFFFGLTYGLLQIVTERAILRREHLVGLRLAPYLAAKATVLLPFLLIVVALMLAVLRGLDRLPPDDITTYLSMGISLTLVATAALVLGLLTSAGVSHPSQATLALPMLCFPAVLFSGAILPVHVMASVGTAISVLMPTRWGFEALGHDLGVRELLLEGGNPLGPPLVATYGDAGTDPTGVYWLILAVFAVALFGAAWAMLRRTCRTSAR